MRRRRSDESPVPPRLAYFDPNEWRGVSPMDKYRLWRDARLEWLHAGNEWPGGPLMLIRQQYAVRLRINGLPLPARLGPNGEFIAVDRWARPTDPDIPATPPTGKESHHGSSK